MRFEHTSEHLAETVADKLEHIGGVLEIAHLAHSIKEQYGFMALFLESFNLSAIGLGRPPDEHVVSAVPSNEAVAAFASDGGPPLNLGAKGLMWRYGAQLASMALRGELTKQQFMHLYVYEVSECAQGRPCGPGYHGQSGIVPELYFQLVSRTSTFAGTITETAVLRYNAAAWMDTQEGLKPR